MATYLPASGYITLNDATDPTHSINQVFGSANSVTPYGNNLQAYVGKTWYKANTATGTFTNPVTMPGDFYEKGPINPVTPGGYRVYLNGQTPVPATPSGYNNVAINTSSYTFTVPLYATLTVAMYGGSGGSGGTGGTFQGGSGGGAGGASVFGASPASYYGVGYPGNGGSAGTSGGSTPGTAGAGSIGYPQGGASPSGYGGYAGGRGGDGGRTVLSLVNPQNGMPLGTGQTYGPLVGSTVAVNLGGAGGGGGGGVYFFGSVPYNTAGGNSGAWGWVDIGWT